MTALNFPANPINGQTYENYVYDGTDGVWKRVSNPTGSLENLDDVDLTNPAMGDSLVYDGSGWVNGPRSNNAIINGDFGVWQRGTTFGPSATNEYSADRWFKAPSSSIMEVTRESFTPADIEAIGYGDAEYYLRMDITVGNNFANILQRIEDVRTFADQTVTLSFWARSDSTRTYRAVMSQSFGSGGSSTVNFVEDVEIGTSWQRYTVTKTLGSMSGKTIGDNSFLQIQIDSGAYADVFTLDIWGVQLEAGSVATPFRLAGGGSKAAELALCQKYYQFLPSTRRLTETITTGIAYSTSGTFGPVLFPKMRDTPSVTTTGTFAVTTAIGTRVNAGTVQIFFIGNGNLRLDLSSVPGSPLVAGNASVLYATSSGAKIMLDAEL